jgi:aryl-alcohol dehydrogenase-like predicted oxidoreductase
LAPATFGGANEFFKGLGSTEVEEARRLIDICFEAGVNLFDTADGYSERPLGRDAGQGARRASATRR